MMMTITSTIPMKVSSLLGLSPYFARTNSLKPKQTLFGRIKEKCFNLHVFMLEDHAPSLLLKKGIGLAHMNNGRIYSCLTTQVPLTGSYNTTTNLPEFGTLSKEIFLDSMVLWQAQHKQIQKILDTSLPASKKWPSKKSSSINQSRPMEPSLSSQSASNMEPLGFIILFTPPVDRLNTAPCKEQDSMEAK